MLIFYFDMALQTIEVNRYLSYTINRNHDETSEYKAVINQHQ